MKKLWRGFDKLLFGHRLCATNKIGHKCAQACLLGGLLCERWLVMVGIGGRRAWQNLKALGILQGRPFGGFGAGDRALLAASAVALLHCLGSSHRACCCFAQNFHDGGIGNDCSDEEETTDVAKLRPCETEDKRAKCDHRGAKNKREDFEAKACTDGQQAEEAAKNSVAEEAAKAERMCPCFAWYEGRSIDGEKRKPDWCEDQAADGAVCSEVEGETKTPSKERGCDAPASPSDDHKERCSDGCSDATHPVLDWSVCGREPRGVIGIVGGNHSGCRQSHDDKPNADQLFAAFFDGFCHFAIEKRIASTCLVCHFPSSSAL